MLWDLGSTAQRSTGEQRALGGCGGALPGRAMEPGRAATRATAWNLPCSVERGLRPMGIHHARARMRDAPPGRRLPRASTIALVALLGCMVAGAPGPALGDSLSFLGQGGGTYWYLANTDSDFFWEAGDVVSLTGMSEVTGANEPFGFNVAYTPSSVTWTCTQQRLGLTFFNLQSITGPAPAPYSIASEDPSSGWVPGPAYTREPTTMVMFCAGLTALGAAAWRRRCGRARSG